MNLNYEKEQPQRVLLAHKTDGHAVYLIYVLVVEPLLALISFRQVVY
jgi:hypothetical protein